MDPIVLQIERGAVSLPDKLRARYELEEGDTLTLVDLGGFFILSPEMAFVPKLTAELAAARRKAGLSLVDLLEGLNEQRRNYVREQYGNTAASDHAPNTGGRRRPRRGRILHDRG